jgi:hypothetical protein
VCQNSANIIECHSRFNIPKWNDARFPSGDGDFKFEHDALEVVARLALRPLFDLRAKGRKGRVVTAIPAAAALLLLFGWPAEFGTAGGDNGQRRWREEKGERGVSTAVCRLFRVCCMRACR